MDPKIIEYIKIERTCVVAVEMPDGSPHSATVHFAHAEDPLRLVILTDRHSKKAEPFLRKDTIRASVVIGTQESEMKTL
jgi:general stress protein 26